MNLIIFQSSITLDNFKFALLIDHLKFTLNR